MKTEMLSALLTFIIILLFCHYCIKVAFPVPSFPCDYIVSHEVHFWCLVDWCVSGASMRGPHRLLPPSLMVSAVPSQLMGVS